MTIDELIQRASEHKGLLTVAAVESARAEHESTTQLMDRCARVIAERYWGGEYEYGFADAAMTGFFGFDH